jgi:hypothetical protein
MTGTFHIGDEIIVRDNDRGIESKRRIVGDADGSITLEVVEIMCEACGENDGGDYNTGDHHLCAGCVMSALRVRAITHLLNEVVPNLDTSTARTLSILDEEDARNAARHMSYVDSLSASFDEIDHMDMRDVLDLLVPIVSHAFDHRHAPRRP